MRCFYIILIEGKSDTVSREREREIVNIWYLENFMDKYDSYDIYIYDNNSNNNLSFFLN